MIIHSFSINKSVVDLALRAREAGTEGMKRPALPRGVTPRSLPSSYGKDVGRMKLSHHHRAERTFGGSAARSVWVGRMGARSKGPQTGTPREAGPPRTEAALFSKEESTCVMLLGSISSFPGKHVQR